MTTKQFSKISTYMSLLIALCLLTVKTVYPATHLPLAISSPPWWSESSEQRVFSLLSGIGNFKLKNNLIYKNRILQNPEEAFQSTDVPTTTQESIKVKLKAKMTPLKKEHKSLADELKRSTIGQICQMEISNIFLFRNNQWCKRKYEHGFNSGHRGEGESIGPN